MELKPKSTTSFWQVGPELPTTDDKLVWRPSTFTTSTDSSQYSNIVYGCRLMSTHKDGSLSIDIVPSDKELALMFPKHFTK